MRYNRNRTVEIATTQVVEGAWSPKSFEHGNDHPSFTTVIHTWNYTNYAISVSDRFGLSYVAKPITGGIGYRAAEEMGKAFKRGVYFTVEYRQLVEFYNNEIRGSIFDSRNVRDQSSPNPILRNLKQAKDFVTINNRRYKVHYVDFFFPESAVKSMLDVTYLQDLDLLISTCEDTSMLPHPFCREGHEELGIRLPRQAMVPTQGLTIYFVDNRGNVPPLYVNLGGKVIELSPTVDFDCAPGFYFFEHKINFDEKHRPNISDPDTQFFTLEELRSGKGPVNVYMTREEAETFGHPEKEYDEKLKERDRQWEIEKREMESTRLKEKMDFEREMDDLKRTQQQLEAKHKQELAELEHKHKERMARLEEEKAKLKAELEELANRRKDYYDSRSSSRKDSSEGWITGLKVASVVAAVGVTAFKLFM